MAGTDIAQTETDRISELRRYHILDTPPDGAFDDIARLASQFFDAPIAIISLVDEDRVWFKSACGLEGVHQIERGPGLCASAIMQDGVYVAEDLKQDPNSLANPLVARANGFRFYAAAPLKSSRGSALGTICVLDVKPRTFTAENAKQLQSFGRLVMAQMEHRLASRAVADTAAEIARKNTLLEYAANHDVLTGLLNRRSIDTLLAKYWNPSVGRLDGAVLLLDIDNFKAINDKHGHHTGDATLVAIADCIRGAVRSTDFVGRYGGEEFIVYLDGCDLVTARRVAERVRLAVEEFPVGAAGLQLKVTISGGLCLGDAGPSISRILQLADEALYTAKCTGRNRIVLAGAADAVPPAVEQAYEQT
ncbi:MAG: diguanylate cyclase domain-containing protein [Hyphomicrobiaceae bacterium]